MEQERNEERRTRRCFFNEKREQKQVHARCLNDENKTGPKINLRSEKEGNEREREEERERTWYNEGNGFILSFVSPLIRSLSLTLSLVDHLPAGNELPDDILREKGLDDSRGEGKRKKWKVGERGEEKGRPEREGREQELTSEIV